LASTTEDVIVRYRAEVDELNRELNVLIKAQTQIVKGEEKVNTETKKQVSTAEFAARKRTELIKLETAELRKLAQIKKLAFDPKQIEQLNTKIAQSEKNISLLKGETSAFGKSATAIFSGIGAGIVAAFSVQAITAFAQSSIAAFLEAEKSATRLRFAVTAIAGETEATFQKLIAQATEIQNGFGIADEEIQSAQSALLSFGLSSLQVEQAIPVLLDFATITGQTVPEAANAMGQAIKGRAGEFKRFGVQVNETQTDVENFNAIIEGLASQQGAAAKETETLTGQLRRQAAEVDELQEKIGEGLAPAWVAVKHAIFEATLGLLGFNKAQEELGRANVKAIANDFEKAADKIKASGGDVEKEFSERIKELTATSVAASEALTKARERLASANLNKEPGIPNNNITDPLKEEIALNEKIVSVTNEKIKQINIIVSAAAQQRKDAESLLKIEDLRLKTTQQLTKELAEQEKGNSIFNQSNVKLINKVLEEQKKAASEAKAFAEKQDAELLKNQQRLRDLQIQNIEDQKQKRIAQFEDETQKLTAKGQLRNDIIRELEIQLLRDLNRIDEQRNVDPLFRVPEIKVSTPETISDRPSALSTEDLSDGIKRVEDLDELIKQQQEQLVFTTADLLNNLTSLYAVFTDARIEQIEREKNAQLESLDLQQEQIETNLKKRRISEKDAERLTLELSQNRIRIEEEAAQKERNIKRKQAALDKANALIQISINTAQAVTKVLSQTGTLGLALQAFIIASGAAQAAIVLAQPIPYEKGSKNTGRTGHMARVGERGEEFVWMPANSKVLPHRQTRQYSEAIDAMYDNRFDSYIDKKHVQPELKKLDAESHAEMIEMMFRANFKQYVNHEYIMPRLQQQKKQLDEKKSRDFSDNIARSMIINVMNPAKKKGIDQVHIANTQELAELFYNLSRKSPFR
jgi:hypothetical protein